MSDFKDLPDLASEAVGGAAIACNDEFFAEKENLVKPAAPEWREHAYTDRGKWMDGWETRRYRPADGVAPGRDSEVHDWCIVRLGMPGVIRGVVVDTAFFRGNFPDTAALDGATIDDPLDLAALANAAWTELVARRPLEGNAQNQFGVASTARFTHVRLRIYPDGGVARLHVHGDVVPRWERLRGTLVDLAALEHGAVVETCSDMFFGSRTNLIKPGPSRSMADGWETRRRRGPGNEWAIVRLAAPGTIERLEIDTSHFKGNAPAKCTVEVVRSPNTAADKLSGWRTLLASPLQAHTRHVFDRELRRTGEVTHLRLSVYPCGGVARLRAWGMLAPDVPAGLARLNAMTPLEATAAVLRCCGSSAWAAAMTGARPFEDMAAVQRVAERAWWALGEADYLEAFAAHPRIGESKPKTSQDPNLSGTWATVEQAGAQNTADATRAALAEANRAYEAKHGFIFIVCAAGRSGDAMLADLLARFERNKSDELRTAAEEQAKITRLRLVKLMQELA